MGDNYLDIKSKETLKFNIYCKNYCRYNEKMYKM